jgi:ATP-dependent DNA helicase RecG
MITKQELTELLSSTETYRIERTVSTTDKDKFGEAVCAFANDMPDSGKPGYLLIGVYNDGRLSGLKATDELLQKFAAIRSDGNILPIPAMAVEAFSFPEGDVIAVEVQPSDQPPVRYRGRTWIRIGPRRDIASPAEETILAERKARNFTTFDARPCFGASLDDIDLDLFQHDYLPKAIDAAILASDDRPIERKLESLRLFNSVYNLPTNAAVLLFGRDPRHFFPGAAVQHVSFGGLDKGTEILNEHLFKGPIMKMLPQIDLFIETTIARKRPVLVTALREEMRVDYPKAAIRELVMNAIMHRDYQGNAPIHFYQYSDRIEVVNHGGLYGRARPENFPNISDYRNPIVAEAMKVLGYVNCYNRGIADVQRELAANGNGSAEFSFRLITAFEAKVAKAGSQQELDQSIRDSSMKSNLKSSLKTRDKILKIIEVTPSITLSELATKLDMSLAGIKKHIRQLQTEGSLRRIGPDKGGHWEVVK